ncbi:hypothetical protein IF1G_01403 [Cordyceps javanica]|uniref:Uncharacterized protein n=1 Tax=Cordyceps javanica TaxID=43265 RepID=A0A545VBW1_9HYPO|nr:hypothetical protein IF1G_01403 [Cordyceps javanica]
MCCTAPPPFAGIQPDFSIQGRGGACSIRWSTAVELGFFPARRRWVGCFLADRAVKMYTVSLKQLSFSHDFFSSAMMIREMEMENGRERKISENRIRTDGQQGKSPCARLSSMRPRPALPT